jgi:hypothetical protein
MSKTILLKQGEIKTLVEMKELLKLWKCPTLNMPLEGFRCPQKLPFFSSVETSG